MEVLISIHTAGAEEEEVHMILVTYHMSCQTEISTRDTGESFIHGKIYSARHSANYTVTFRKVIPSLPLVRHTMYQIASVTIKDATPLLVSSILLPVI